MKAATWRPLTWAVLLGGCTPLGLWLYEDPVVTVARITVQSARSSADTAPVIVALALQNSNDYPLEAEQVELSLRLDGIPIGRLKRNSAVSLATDTVSTVALPVPVDRGTTAEHLRKIGSGTHTFAVRGRATFQTPIGKRNVRFAQEGSLVFGVRPSGSTN
ncbi:MAG TPA: LEA type 2 family protein [Gemmatimonadales bacterium]|nr:LEA type 2 family protein [Gemmatimonadales bacterium]